jgi:putative oxidoreductase
MIIDSFFLLPASLLLLRIIIAIIFFSSGKSHAQHPVERAKSIGMSPSATKVLGIVEIIASLSIALGIYTQVGALLIIFVMLGAMQKKIFVWHTGFYEEKGYGWHYDLLLLIGALVILATNGGMYVLF